MMQVYKELLKSNVMLVRRVMAGTEPPKEIEIDLTDEFYEPYADDWKELIRTLYWLMAAVCVVALFLGIYGVVLHEGRQKTTVARGCLPVR